MNIDLSKLHLFEMPELHYFEHTCEVRTFALADSIRNQEKYLAETKEDFARRLKEDVDYKKLEEKYRGGYYDQMFLYEEENIKEIELIQRYSTCQILIASLEDQMKTLCELVSKHIASAGSKFTSTQNGNIERYWNYLNGQVGGFSEEVKQMYGLILQRKKIRNLVTHHNGFVSKERFKKLQMAGISSNSVGNIVKIKIESIFLLQLNSDIRKFTELLLMSIDSQYRSKR